VGLPTWTCSFRRFGGFGVGRPSPSHRVPFFSTCGVGKPFPSRRVRFSRRFGVEKPFSHIAFAFRDVSEWGNPPRHVTFAFSDVSGWGNPSRTSRSRFPTFRDGETLPVTSRSLLSTCWGGFPNSTRPVRLYRHLVYIFCKLLIIYTFLLRILEGNPYGFQTLRVPVPPPAENPYP
jgi:hypothetical protein